MYVQLARQPSSSQVQLSITEMHIAKLPASYGCQANLVHEGVEGDCQSPLSHPPTHTWQLTRGCIQMHTGVWWVKLVAPNTAPAAVPPKSAPVALHSRPAEGCPPIPPLSSSLSTTNAILNKLVPSVGQLDWVHKCSGSTVRPDEGCPRPPHPLSCTPTPHPHPYAFHPPLHPARILSLQPRKKA